MFKPIQIVVMIAMAFYPLQTGAKGGKTPKNKGGGSGTQTDTFIQSDQDNVTFDSSTLTRPTEQRLRNQLRSNVTQRGPVNMSFYMVWTENRIEVGRYGFKCVGGLPRCDSSDVDVRAQPKAYFFDESDNQFFEDIGFFVEPSRHQPGLHDPAETPVSLVDACRDGNEFVTPPGRFPNGTPFPVPVAHQTRRGQVIQGDSIFIVQVCGRIAPMIQGRPAVNPIQP